MKLLIKFPTRNRKEKFFSTFKKYQEFIVEDSTKFSITIDEDDESMNNENVINELTSYINTEVTIGNSNSKIDAINRDIDTNSDWDTILLASDDMIPQIKGFDKIINTLMESTYPDTDGILFFNDGFKKEELNTLCVLGKKYYQRFNYIYYPEYKSTWCDNEFMMVGNILKKQKYFPMVIIKHEHPDWGYGERDMIHHKNYSDLSFDMKLFKTRKSNNFYL
jgi:hypothetical protein